MMSNSAKRKKKELLGAGPLARSHRAGGPVAYVNFLPRIVSRAASSPGKWVVSIRMCEQPARVLDFLSEEWRGVQRLGCSRLG